MRSTFKRVVAGVLSVSMAISNLSVPGLSFAAAADEPDGGGSSTGTDASESQTHVIITHHHASGREETVSESGDVKIDPDQDGTPKDIEILNGYTISAGQRAVTGTISVNKGDDGAAIEGGKVQYTNSLTVTPRDDVHLVKIDLYYRDLPDTSNEGQKFEEGGVIKDSDQKEILGEGTDVRYDEENNKFIYDTSEGLHTNQSITVDPDVKEDGTGETKQDTREFELTLESWYAGNNSIADIGMVLDASGSMAFTYDAPSVIDVLDTWSTPLDDSFNSVSIVERGFKIDSFAGTENFEKEVEMDDNAVSALYVEYQPLLAYVFTHSDKAKEFEVAKDTYVDFSASDGCISAKLYGYIDDVDNCEEYDGKFARDYFEKTEAGEYRLKTEDLKYFYVGEDGMPYLTNAGVSFILDPTKTDTSRLGYADYTYFVYDPREGTKEFVPLGYWDGNNKKDDPIDEEALSDGYVGYYKFDNSLKNSVKGSEPGKASYPVKLGTDGKIQYNTEEIPDTVYSLPFAKDEKTNENGIELSQLLKYGVLDLDASPSLKNGFSIAIRLRMKQEADLKTVEKTPLLLITDGDSTGSSENYLEFFRREEDKSHQLRVVASKNMFDREGQTGKVNYADMKNGFVSTSSDKFGWVNLFIIYDAGTKTLKLRNPAFNTNDGKLDIKIEELGWNDDTKLKLILGGDKKGKIRLHRNRQHGCF